MNKELTTLPIDQQRRAVALELAVDFAQQFTVNPTIRTLLYLAENFARFVHTGSTEVL